MTTSTDWANMTRSKCAEPECDEWFDHHAARDARYCSNRCTLRASRKRRRREEVDMATLRERVTERLAADLRANVGPLADLVVDELVSGVFEAMQGARPCVTCGKGIGPAKVAKGYVQCYDCTRKPTTGAVVPRE